MDWVASPSQVKKVAEYLVTGKVQVVAASKVNARFAVHGSDVYYTTFSKNVGWHCTCPARKHPCSHILACYQVYSAEEPTHAVIAAGDEEIDALLGS